MPRRIVGVKTPWSVVDAQTLRTFLSTTTGHNLVDKIFTSRPRVTERTDPVKRAIQSGIAEGYEEFFNQLDYLCKPESADRS